MNLPTAILTIRWMTWDTFRQARASGILWLMLGISALCTIFCLSASVHGDRPLQNPDGPTEFLPRSYGAAQRRVSPSAASSRPMLRCIAIPAIHFVCYNYSWRGNASSKSHPLSSKRR
jgi:hypothetical protein